MDTRLVFMGSPTFALPSLQKLAEQYKVIGVVTQPDRPAGRGRALVAPPVKDLALRLGLPFIQPRRLREPEAMDQLRAWSPDLIVVAAFGQILRPEVLDLPPFGSINVHASLLPRWRGAAPIHAAILHGDRRTGITIMKMDPGLDTGPILRQRAIPIRKDDTSASLSDRLAEIGAELLAETLPDYLSGQLEPQPQPEEGVTSAPMLKKSAGELDFTQPAEDLARRVRAFDPWPGTYTFFNGQILKILRAHSEPDEAAPQVQKHGERTTYHKFPAIRTARGILVLDIVQPAGKKTMAGDVFLRGARNWIPD